MVVNGGNANVPFEFCPKTFTTIQVAGTTVGGSLKTAGTLPVGHASFSRTDPGVVFGTSGNTIEAYCFPDANPASPWCTNGLDNVTPVFTFTAAACPGLPANEFPAASGNDTMEVYSDLTDRYFEMGKALWQNGFGVVLIYDHQTGNCTWELPTTLQYGGSGYGSTQKANGGPLGDPTSPGGQIPAPNFSVSTASGSIPAGTYYAVITENTQEPDNNLNGESTPSLAAGPITLSALGTITITPKPCIDATWCTTTLEPNFHVYLGASATGPFWLQDYLPIGTGNGTQLTFGPATIPANVYSQLGSVYNILAGTGTGQTMGDNEGATITVFNPSTAVSMNIGSVNGSGVVNLSYPSGNAPANGVPIYATWFTGCVNFGGLCSSSPYSDAISTYQTNTLQPPTVNSSGIGLH
ncbi:MAG: hypothetical protein ACRD2G_00105, partial [Terriglobia bacterium]